MSARGLLHDMTISDLTAALSALDPKLELTIVLYVKAPGNKSPPRVVLGAKPPGEGLTHQNFNVVELREIRALVKDQSFVKVANKFKCHRSTISRYIHTESKAGRMGKTAYGWEPAKGAYDLETGAVVPVEVKT